MINLLENIKNEYSKKNIKSLCNKLQKKCSFKSETDILNLTHLAFWMYIWGDFDKALKIIDKTINLTFNGKYNIWDYIHNLWMLKARILRLEENFGESKKIIQKVIEHDLTPNGIFNTVEKKLQFRKKIIDRTSYTEISFKQEIESSLVDNELKLANSWRFMAIINMIRYKEEGVYPDLIQKDDLIESDILKYANILKEE